jgi:hypothetical protein
MQPPDASTWPSGGRTRTYPQRPAYPSQPLYPPAQADPSRPLYVRGEAYSQPLPPGVYQPQVVVVVQQPSVAPVIVEVIGGLFGFYGIGWLVGGYAATGVLLLVGSLVLASFWAVVAVATVGVGLFCIIPVDLAILLASTLKLNARLKRQALRALTRQ